MNRKPYKTTRLRARIREDIFNRIEISLFSTAQGRVPYSAWGVLLETLLEEYLSRLAEAQKGQANGNGSGLQLAGVPDQGTGLVLDDERQATT